MKNPIRQFEWRTRDAARLKSFYGAVFDWHFTDAMAGYTRVSTGGIDGGIFELPVDEPGQTGTCAYAAVEELGPYEDRARAAGGRVVTANNEVPGVGWFTVLLDPDGNSFAIWKMAPPVNADDKQDKVAKKAEKNARKALKEAQKNAGKEAKKKGGKKHDKSSDEAPRKAHEKGAGDEAPKKAHKKDRKKAKKKTPKKTAD